MNARSYYSDFSTIIPGSTHPVYFHGNPMVSCRIVDIYMQLDYQGSKVTIVACDTLQLVLSGIYQLKISTHPCSWIVTDVIFCIVIYLPERSLLSAV